MKGSHIASERPRYEREDEEPTYVDEDIYPENARNFHYSNHVDRNASTDYPQAENAKHAGVKMTMFFILRDAITAFNTDKVPRLAAALSYYLVFSIAPLVIVLITLIDHLISLHPGAASEHAVRAEIISKLTGIIGQEGARAVDAFMIAVNAQKRTGAIANLMGWALVILGASGLFGALQDALNTIFEAPTDNGGWMRVVRDRATSLFMIIVVAVLLALSTLAQAAVGSAAHAVGILPSNDPAIAAMLHAGGWTVSAVALVLLFGILYRILPDVSLPWKSIVRGAAITTLLFLAGEAIINVYLARVATASTYGAIGSIVILLLWLNYSMQTILFGAELTKVLDNIDKAHAEKMQQQI